ncbi:hypothetical protein QJS04_geneDACA014284 [Acorus gramineus]|uniref:Uncharacterized protein n=1 Tax=Acorus gramineus TaxID=55184 RepID=A0AAV9BY90_ACOGR|nr:hypothetical protein QJS04_geneDACA014284 [Acorus gramineus]
MRRTRTITTTMPICQWEGNSNEFLSLESHSNKAHWMDSMGRFKRSFTMPTRLATFLSSSSSLDHHVAASTTTMMSEARIYSDIMETLRVMFFLEGKASLARVECREVSESDLNHSMHGMTRSLARFFRETVSEKNGGRGRRRWKSEECSKGNRSTSHMIEGDESNPKVVMPIVGDENAGRRNEFLK